MSTWEERMSQRAKARQAAEQAREVAAREARLAEIAKTLPALPGEHRINWGGDHLGHLSHECGNSSWCSCGEHLGIFSIVVPDPEDMPPPCEICKARKIGQFARAVGEQEDGATAVHEEG